MADGDADDTRMATGAAPVEEAAAWRSSPLVVVAVAVAMSSDVVSSLLRWSVSRGGESIIDWYRDWAAVVSAVQLGAGLVYGVLMTIASRELAGRATGAARRLLQVAAVGFGLALALKVGWFVVVDVLVGRGGDWARYASTLDWLGRGLRMLLLVAELAVCGAALAGARGRARTPAMVGLILAVPVLIMFHPPALAMWRAIGGSGVGVMVLRLVLHAVAGALVIAAAGWCQGRAHGEPPVRWERASDAFRLIGSALIARVVIVMLAAISGFSLRALGSSMALLVTPGAVVITELVVSVGLVRLAAFAAPGAPRVRLGFAAAAMLTLLAIDLSQLLAIYQLLRGVDRSWGDLGSGYVRVAPVFLLASLLVLLSAVAAMARLVHAEHVARPLVGVGLLVSASLGGAAWGHRYLGTHGVGQGVVVSLLLIAAATVVGLLAVARAAKAVGDAIALRDLQDGELPAAQARFRTPPGDAPVP